MPAKIRKHQTTLICSGLAVIAFGLWSIVRTLLLLFFRESYLHDLAEPLINMPDISISLDTLVTVLYVVLFSLLILDLLLRLYIGLSALAEGGGKRRRAAYLVLAALSLSLSLLSDIYVLASAPITDELLASVIVDLTSCFSLYQILFSGFALRRYTRLEGGSDHAA